MREERPVCTVDVDVAPAELVRRQRLVAPGRHDERRRQDGVIVGRRRLVCEGRSSANEESRGGGDGKDNSHAASPE
jgi:hypothetical protein